MVGRGGFKYAGLCREWEPHERNAAEEIAINEIGCGSTKALRLSNSNRMVFQGQEESHRCGSLAAKTRVPLGHRGQRVRSMPVRASSNSAAEVDGIFGATGVSPRSSRERASRCFLPLARKPKWRTRMKPLGMTWSSYVANQTMWPR